MQWPTTAKTTWHNASTMSARLCQRIMLRYPMTNPRQTVAHVLLVVRQMFGVLPSYRACIKSPRLATSGSRHRASTQLKWSIGLGLCRETLRPLHRAATTQTFAESGFETRLQCQELIHLVESCCAQIFRWRGSVVVTTVLIFARFSAPHLSFFAICLIWLILPSFIHYFMIK